MKEIIQTSTEDRFMLLMMKYILKQKTIIYIHMNYIHKKMNEIYVCLHVLHTSKSYKKNYKDQYYLFNLIRSSFSEC